MRISFVREDGEVVTAHVECVIHRLGGSKVYRTQEDDVSESQVLEKLPDDAA